ncbi:hypothetical protein E3N88_23708 [Mikania micrantha]|uniref:CCHC-type domain-containing protein n=1 Tax=Mikania micrantha TaxID=192012 RepID=A0A5N6NG26_9ASTR|nr:hypothetical protein E3N88_23708 [Mikania micrantha]
MVRLGGSVTCAKCGHKGHNKRSCKGQGNRRPGFLLVQEGVHDVLDPHEHITNWSAIEEDEDLEDEDMFHDRCYGSEKDLGVLNVRDCKRE